MIWRPTPTAALLALLALAISFLREGANLASAASKDEVGCYNSETYGDEVAIFYCSHLIQRNPQDVVARYKRGIGHYHKSNYKLAIADLDVVVRAKPQDAKAIFYRGASYQGLGDYNHAIADEGEALRLDPTSLEALSSRAAAYIATGDRDRALADYSSIVKLRPQDPDVYLERADKYRAWSEYDLAIADVSSAIDLDQDAHSYFARGALYAEKGDQDKAIADFDAAIRIRPSENEQYYERRGLSYEAKGDYDRALADFDHAIGMVGFFNANAYFYRASVYEKTLRLSEALADYKTYLSAAPSDAAGAAGVARVEDLLAAQATASTPPPDKKPAPRDECERDVYASFRFDRAVDACTKLVQRDPQNAEAYHMRGLAYLGLKQLSLAISDFDEAIRLNPQGAEIYVDRGDIYEEQGDLSHAIAEFGQAIRLDPRNARAYYVRGSAQEKLHRLGDALADFKTYATLAPSDAARDSDIARVEKEISQQAAVANVPPPAAVPAPPPTALAEKRVALVIGNSAYSAVPALLNPKRDAASVADALRSEAFDVILATDATRPQMVAALHAFEKKAAAADWALVYYAGHGVEAGGRNYLIPIDATLESDSQASDEAVSLDRIEAAVQGARKLRLVLLDACRNNPFLPRMAPAPGMPRAVDRGLKPPEPNPGTIIVYATRAGSVASDGDGDHSPFTTAFLREIARPGLEVRRLFDFVRDDVMEATKNNQQPFAYGSLPAREDYYFRSIAN